MEDHSNHYREYDGCLALLLRTDIWAETQGDMPCMAETLAIGIIDADIPFNTPPEKAALPVHYFITKTNYLGRTGRWKRKKGIIDAANIPKNLERTITKAENHQSTNELIVGLEVINAYFRLPHPRRTYMCLLSTGEETLAQLERISGPSREFTTVLRNLGIANDTPYHLESTTQTLH